MDGQTQNVTITGNILRNNKSRGVAALGGAAGHQNLRINLIHGQTAVPENGFVTATASGPDGTSEFSGCRPYVFVNGVFANGFE